MHTAVEEALFLESYENVSEPKLTLGILAERVGNHIKFFWGAAAVFGVWLAGISFILYQMNGDIGKLRLPQQLEQTSNTPQNQKSQNQAASLLGQAKLNGIRLPEPVIQYAGTRFIEAAETEPSAWKIALDFLNYRSTLNVYVRPVKAVNVPAGSETHFDIGPAVDGKPIPELAHIPIGVAPADAARFEKIGQNLNQNLQFGSAQLILKGGAVSLDDKYARHVFFEGVEIHYSGKPLILQDAVFSNCTFILDNTPYGRQLGQTLLASSTINFEKTS